MDLSSNRRLFPAIKVALAAGLAVATCGLFLPPEGLAQTTLTLCAGKSGNVTMAKKGKCAKGATTLTVNEAGVQGPAGPQGAPGSQGPAGPAGGLQLVDSNGTVVGPLYPGLNGAPAHRP